MLFPLLMLRGCRKCAALVPVEPRPPGPLVLYPGQCVRCVMRLPLLRRCSSSKAYDMLTGEYKLSPILARGVLLAMAPSPGASVTVTELNKYGKAGIEAMAQAVQREQQAMQGAAQTTVGIFVSAPHRGLHNIRVDAQAGNTLFDLSKSSTIIKENLECACGGIAACSTCHIIIDPTQADWFPPAEEAEQDMLDLAAALTDTYVTVHSFHLHMLNPKP